MSPKSRLFSCCILAGLMLAGCSWETALYDSFVDADGDLNPCPPKNANTDATLAYIDTIDCTKDTASSGCPEDYTFAFEYGLCPAKFSLCSQDGEKNWFCQKVSCAEGQFLCFKNNGNRYCADPLAKDTCGITSACDGGKECGAAQECRFLDAENKYDCLCPADSLKCDTECLHPESKLSCGASCENHAGKVCSDEESCVKGADGNYDCILGCAEGQFRCYDKNGKQYCADPQSKNTCGIKEDCDGGTQCHENQHCGLDETTQTYQCKIGCGENQFLCLKPDGSQYCADPTSTSYCGITEACNDGVKCGEQQICAEDGASANKRSCKCPGENALTCGTGCLYPNEKATCGATCDNPEGTACTDKQICQKQDNQSFKCTLVCGDNQIRCDAIDQCLTPTDLKTCGATCDNPEGTACTENESCQDINNDGNYSCRLGCAEGQFQCEMPEKDEDGNDKLDDDSNVLKQKICVDPKSKEYCGIQPDCTSFVACGADQSCSAVKVKGEDVETESYVCTCPEGQTTCGTRCVNPGGNDTCGITCDEKSTGEVCNAGELFFCQTKTTGTDDKVTTSYSCECYTGYDKVTKIVESTQPISETNDEPVTPAVEKAVCINPLSDKDYCGASHVQCGEGQFCANGECQCTNGGYICNGKCVLPKDHDSCNIDETCMNGIRCQDNESCVLTTDHYECLLTKCEENENLCITDESRECIAKTDLNHCGKCNNDCAKKAGEGQIVKSCAEPQSDQDDEYICKYECDADSHYAQCHGQTACVNIYTDINNCGECGKQCTGTNICIEGECKDNECEGNQCQFDNIEGTPICVSVSVACGRTCDNCKAKGQVCNEEGICAGEVQCLEGTHPVFDENGKAFKCEENTDYKCAPKDSTTYDPVDCTKDLPENSKWGKCVGDGECEITCNINFVLNDKNECICPEDYEIDEAGNCVKINYVTDCVAERYPANYHVAEDRRSCVPNSNDACAASTWDGEDAYTSYVQSCADPLVCKDDGTCKCSQDNYELNVMNLCIPPKCKEQRGHEYITSFRFGNDTCKIDSCGNGFTPSDRYLLEYYRSCKCNNTTCGDQCVNTKTDINNCGSCGNVCSDTYSCNDGKCGCTAGQLECNGKCVANDVNNCGACGNKCNSNQTCSNGICMLNCTDNKDTCNNLCNGTSKTGEYCKFSNSTSTRICNNNKCQDLIDCKAYDYDEACNNCKGHSNKSCIRLSTSGDSINGYKVKSCKANNKCN